MPWQPRGLGAAGTGPAGVPAGGTADVRGVPASRSDPRGALELQPVTSSGGAPVRPPRPGPRGGVTACSPPELPSEPPVQRLCPNHFLAIVFSSRLCFLTCSGVAADELLCTLVTSRSHALPDARKVPLCACRLIA